MRNTIILTAALFLSIIAVTIFYFKNLDNDLNSSKPLSFLPQNTLFIASIGNDKETEDIFKEFEIFDAILGTNNIKIWNIFKTKLLNREKISGFTNESDIFISFHPNKKEISTLFTIPTKEPIPNTEIMGIINDISKDFKLSTIDTLGNKIYQIQYGQKDSILNATYYQDILFASPSLDLITKILDKHTKHLSADQIDFFTKSNPRTTPLSVYFPHQQYDSLINLTQKNDKGPFINLFKKLHGQSAWNINFKEDALILSGESQLDQYPENYASLFKNQQKTTQYLYQYFPSNTAIYAEFSISNRTNFQKDLHNLFKRREEKIANQVDTTRSTELLTQALGTDFALVETNNQDYLGFISIIDSSKLSELKGVLLEKNIDSIGRFQKSDVLYRQYGDVFKDLNRPYYTIIDSILIVANNSSTLRTYRKDYIENDLLTGTLGFIKLEKLQSKEANINIFVHSKNANSKILNSLKDPFRKNFKDKDNFSYQDFFSWSLQLSGNNGNMTSQIYAIYKSKNTLGTTAEWTFTLGEKAVTKPYIFNESDTSQLILIQKLDHTLYALNAKGQQIWSKVFSGRIIGDIQQLEDRTILFTTDKNHLYRIDEKGNTLKGFPIKLDFTVQKTSLLTTINKQKSILIPSENKIYAFNLNGTPQPNWNFPSVEGSISTRILEKDNKYIFGTSTGNIYWFQPNNSKTEQVKVSSNPIIDLTLSDNYKAISLDKKGEMNLLSKDGKNKKWQVTKDSSQYYGSFDKINTSKNNTLTIVQRNQLNVYEIADTLKTVYHYIFTKTIANEPQFFVSAENSSIYNIGIASKATNLVYLFNENGQLIDDFPVEALPLFYYGKINYNSEMYLLCMRRDHKLYAFKLKK